MTPYSTTPHRFPFPALAALAGKGRIGGTREIALACLMAARLAAAARATAQGLDAAARMDRSGHARAWFAALPLPVALRTACVRLIEAAGRTDADVAPALAQVLAAARRQLDRDSVLELERAVRQLER